MAFDRDGTLRKAEKFVRLGRNDAAIAEYQRVVDETPDDWKTVATLADLFLRAGRADRATPLLARVADNLAREGFAPRAEAFYKRILKVAPADEHALGHLADLAWKRGILVEAKGYLLALAKAQQARNDRRAATETLLRLGALDVGDVSTRIEAARAAASGGDAESRRRGTGARRDGSHVRPAEFGRDERPQAGRDDRACRPRASGAAVHVVAERGRCRRGGRAPRHGADGLRGSRRRVARSARGTRQARAVAGPGRREGEGQRTPGATGRPRRAGFCGSCSSSCGCAIGASSTPGRG